MSVSESALTVAFFSFTLTSSKGLSIVSQTTEVCGSRPICLMVEMNICKEAIVKFACLFIRPWCSMASWQCFGSNIFTRFSSGEGAGATVLGGLVTRCGFQKLVILLQALLRQDIARCGM